MTAREIKRLRKSLKLNQQKFAERLGVGIVTVCRWETGKVEPSPLARDRLKELSEQRTR